MTVTSKKEANLKNYFKETVNRIGKYVDVVGEKKKQASVFEGKN